MNEKNPKVSIIITVYNGDKYLEKSLDSIYQTLYSNFEVVCINDGSTDHSHLICEKYRNKYSNFRYYRQHNHGLAYSRNLGVHLSSGDYLTFVDADDLVSPSMISYLIQMVQKYQAEIAYVDLLTFSRESEIKKSGRTLKEEVCSTEQALLNYFEKKMGNVCGGLFARQLFFNVRFPIGLIYEDNVAKLQLLLNASKIVLTNNPLYYYRKSSNSITTKKVSFKNLDILRIGYKQEKIFQKSKKNVSDEVIKKYQHMISEIVYELLEKLLYINGKWPKMADIVPRQYLLKILFIGLTEKPLDRIFVFIQILFKIYINY